MKLKPRLTANITIYTLDKRGVLAVPARALRFNPVEPIVGKDAIINDCPGEHKLWTKEGNTFTAHPVQTGITNGTYTEILDGVDEGTTVIADAQFGGMPAPQMGMPEDIERSPFAPGPPGRDKDKKKE